MSLKGNMVNLVGQLQQMVDLDDEQFKKLADGLSDKMEIFVDAAAKPLDELKNKIITIMNQMSEKSGQIASNGFFGLMKGVPGLGATLSILGIANTVAAGAEMTADKANNVLEAVSATIDDTMRTVGIEPKSTIPTKIQAAGYSARINNSIEEFKNTSI